MPIKVMYLFFRKAEPFGLFDAPTQVRGHVRKKTGVFVAPYQAVRKKRLQEAGGGEDLFSLADHQEVQRQARLAAEQQAREDAQRVERERAATTDEWDGFHAGDYGAGTLQHGENGRLVLTIPSGVTEGSPSLRKKLKEAGFTAQKNDEWWHKRPRYLVEGAGYQKFRNDADKARIQAVLDALAKPAAKAKGNAPKPLVAEGTHGFLTVRQNGDEWRVTHVDRFNDSVHQAMKRMGAQWDSGGWNVPADASDKLAAFLNRHVKTKAQAAAKAAQEDEEAKQGALMTRQQGGIDSGNYGIAHVQWGENKDGYPGYVVRFNWDADMLSALKRVSSKASFRPEEKTWFIPAGHETALKDWLTRATQIGAKKAQEEKQRQEALAAERQRRQETTSEPRNRMLYPLLDMPPVNIPIRINGRPVVVTGIGQKFSITEDHPSIWGSHLLGREGEAAAYAYYRPADADELTKLEAREAKHGRADF